MMFTNKPVVAYRIKKQYFLLLGKPVSTEWIVLICSIK